MNEDLPMPELPTGTVTFLFTDIEGSTQLLTQLGGHYRAVLERHHEILRSSIARHAGVGLTTEGDAFFAVFAHPPDAVEAVVEAQRLLHAERWPVDVQVRVRMGLLTGEGRPGADAYVGLDVHRAARIAAAAHGGQVLVSDSTRALVGHALPADISLRDLGEHRLKDLPRPERIFQLLIDDLPADFPPPRTVDARPNNLPSPISSFVGRQREIGEIRQRLANARLLTLTGPGGTGKTRLAIRVAGEVLREYEHGCWFVPLDALTDPELVAPAIADALGISVPAARLPIEALESWAADREALFVLDNFEQVTAAAPIVSRLLAAAPRLRVLATSRAPLQAYGEAEYPVPPLALGGDPVHSEAAELFAERAAAVKPSFAATDSNAAAVAEICGRLDGLPLAIELAAARVKILSAEQILARLEDSLSLLASSVIDLPERQRTLTAAIDWSYRLLPPAEQRLFTRLSVFQGGIALEAAEAVASPGLDLDILDGLASLVDKSLLRALELAGETRFAMLETIRQHGAALLAAGADDDERTATLRRHAAYFLNLAVASESELTGVRQAEWLDRLEREDGNLRAAFARASESALLDEALTGAGAMWRFWQQRGHFAEARSIFDRLLALPGSSPAARAKALGGAGGICYWQGDLETMGRCYTEAREIYESLGDRHGLAQALLNEAYIPFMQGDWGRGRERAIRAGELFAELGDEPGVADAEAVLAVSLYFRNDFAGAVGHYENAVAIYRRTGQLLELADVLNNMSFARALTGQWTRAVEHVRESLTIFESAGNELGVAIVLETYAAIAAWVDELARSAHLFGYADATKKRLRGGPPGSLLRTEGYRSRAAEGTGQADFDRLYAEGGTMSQADAIALADFPVPADTPPFPGIGGLTPGDAPDG